jgi:hypothetical protein
MTYITATDGYFPHFFLNDLSTKEANRCIEVLCREFAGYYTETNRLMDLGRNFVAPRLLDDDLQPVAVWKNVCDDARALLECEATTLWLVHGQIAWTLKADGTQHYMPLSGFHKAVVEEEAAIHLNDAYADDRFDREADRKKASRTGSILCQPVIYSHARRSSRGTTACYTPSSPTLLTPPFGSHAGALSLRIRLSVRRSSSLSGIIFSRSQIGPACCFDSLRSASVISSQRGKYRCA